MHLIIPLALVPVCSNSAMKDNNVTNIILYHDIAAKPSQNLLCVSLLEPGIPDYRLPWVFSKRKLFL
jgi:hypothetical protein